MADEETTESEGIRHHIPLPDGAVPLAVVELVEYLTPEGERVYGYRHSGGAGSLSTTLGLIELMKRSLINGAYFAGDDDD